MLSLIIYPTQVPPVDEAEDDAKVLVSRDQDDYDTLYEDSATHGSNSESVLPHPSGSQGVSLTDAASRSSSSGTTSSPAIRQTKNCKRPAASLMQQLLTMRHKEIKHAAKMND